MTAMEEDVYIARGRSKTLLSTVKPCSAYRSAKQGIARALYGVIKLHLKSKRTR